MHILLVAVVFTLFFAYLIKQVKRPEGFPPGPPWVPFIGNMLHLRKMTKSLGGLHLALSRLAQEYGSSVVGLKLGEDYIVSVVEYSLIREVFIREEFEARPDNFFFKMRSFDRRNSGITGSDGLVWSTNRNFVVRHLRSLGFGKPAMETMVKKEVEDIIQVLKNEGLNIDVARLFVVPVLNILWTLTCGRRISRGDPFLEEVFDMLATRGKLFDITGGILSRYPWLRFIAPHWTGYALIQEMNRKLKNMISSVIREHYDSWEEGRDDDLIYSYISEIKKGEKGSVFCDAELLVVCYDIFMAGTQTTSNSLQLLFLTLILNSEIQKRVQEEIDNKIGNNAILEYADIMLKLPYTSAVIMELLRYAHVTPVAGPRRALRDTTLGEYFIPKGTTVFMDFNYMHHNEKLWEDPYVFRPERFLDESGALIKPKHFIPFGLGKRKCLGDVLAKKCLFHFFVEVVRRFNIRLSPESGSVVGKHLFGLLLLSEQYKADFLER